MARNNRATRDQLAELELKLYRARQTKNLCKQISILRQLRLLAMEVL